MLLQSAVTVPFGDQHRYEIKWDGWRAIAYLDRGQLKILSRNLRDITVEYPELTTLPISLKKRRAVLDGEIVTFGADGKPDFAQMQQRLGWWRKVPTCGANFVAFDLLHLDGASLMNEPYSTRRQALDSLDLHGTCWFAPKTYADGSELVAATRKLGLEGVVAKHVDSLYEPGRRPGTWLKLKNTTRDVFVVGGVVPPDARQRHGWKLLVGKELRGKLNFAGVVELGITRAALLRLEQAAPSLVTPESPFKTGPQSRRSYFLKPGLRVTVQYMSWPRKWIAAGTCVQRFFIKSAN